MKKVRSRKSEVGSHPDSYQESAVSCSKKRMLLTSDFGLLTKKATISRLPQNRKYSLWSFFTLKLQASIVEPVIAVIILVISMAMVFTILTQTNITPHIQAINKANELISVELFRTINESDFLDKDEQMGAFRIAKKIEQAKSNTINITIQVFDLKQKEIMQKQLVIANPTISTNEE